MQKSCTTEYNPVWKLKSTDGEGHLDESPTLFFHQQNHTAARVEWIAVMFIDYFGYAWS